MLRLIFATIIISFSLQTSANNLLNMSCAKAYSQIKEELAGMSPDALKRFEKSQRIIMGDRQDKLNDIDVAAWDKSGSDDWSKPLGVLVALTGLHELADTRCKPKTSNETKLVNTFKQQLRDFQQLMFPLARWEFGEEIHKMLWHHQGSAYTLGKDARVLVIVSTDYIINRNIKDTFNQLEETLNKLRFDAVWFTTHETNYTETNFIKGKLSKIKDTEITTLSQFGIK